MNKTLIKLIFLSFFLLSCGNKNRNTAENFKRDTYLMHRTSNAYFTANEFEWFLITDDNVPIYVREGGRGNSKTIVTLHGGFGMDHGYMRDFLKPYEENFHMVYYDQRGSLRSPVPNNDLDEYITMENMVNDLELLRKELGEEKLTLIAHSMGAVLTYEYLRKYPNNVEDIIIISGFTPKFPTTTAEYHDMFTSQKERYAFKKRPSMLKEIKKLKQTTDTLSNAYHYLNWKLQYASCQIYDISNWEKVQGGLGFFNSKMNDLIGPESQISWPYFVEFAWNQYKFDNGDLEKSDEGIDDESPIDYLPEIRNHHKKITYLLARYEFGDWNLRLYNRFLGKEKNVEMHVFEKSCHNIWMDQPEEFHKILSEKLNTLASNKLYSSK